jgi:hypothetical protein
LNLPTKVTLTRKNASKDSKQPPAGLVIAELQDQRPASFNAGGEQVFRGSWGKAVITKLQRDLLLFDGLAEARNEPAAQPAANFDAGRHVFRHGMLLIEKGASVVKLSGLAPLARGQ